MNRQSFGLLIIQLKNVQDILETGLETVQFAKEKINEEKNFKVAKHLIDSTLTNGNETRKALSALVSLLEENFNLRKSPRSPRELQSHHSR